MKKMILLTAALLLMAPVAAGVCDTLDLSALGEIPAYLGFCTVEVADPERFFAGGKNAGYAEAYHLLTCSDAHRTEALLPDASHALHLPACSFAALKAALTTPK